MMGDNYAEAIGWLVICCNEILGVSIVTEDGKPLAHKMGGGCNCLVCESLRATARPA